MAMAAQSLWRLSGGGHVTSGGRRQSWPGPGNLRHRYYGISWNVSTDTVALRSLTVSCPRAL